LKLMQPGLKARLQTLLRGNAPDGVADMIGNQQSAL